MSPPSFAEYSEAQVEALPSVSNDLGSLPQQIFEVIFIRWIGIISCLLPQPHLKKWNIFIFFAIINVGCLPDMSSEQTVVVIVTIAVAIWIVLLVWNMLVSFIVMQNEGCVNLCHVEKDNLNTRGSDQVLIQGQLQKLLLILCKAMTSYHRVVNSQLWPTLTRCLYPELTPFEISSMTEDVVTSNPPP